MHKVGGTFLGKELHHALRHHAAKAVDLADLLCGGFPDRLQRTEMLCQQRGCLIADVADAKAKQKLIQIVLLGGSNGLQQIVCAFLLEFVQFQQLFPGQRVDICCRTHQFLFHQLGGHGLAQTFDIHGVPGGKMDDVAQCLCRTLRVHTAQGRFVLQMHHRRTAGGADRGHGVGFSPFYMMGDPDDLRDDIARLAHLNGIPDAQPELPDEVLVVEGGAGYRSTCQKHRVKAGGGGKHAGAANGHLDAAQGGLLDLRRVFEGNGPAREFVGRTHQLPLPKIVHLDNGTVHVKIQLCTVLANVLDLGNGILDIMHHMVAR